MPPILPTETTNHTCCGVQASFAKLTNNSVWHPCYPIQHKATHDMAHSWYGYWNTNGTLIQKMGTLVPQYYQRIVTIIGRCGFIVGTIPKHE